VPAGAPSGQPGEDIAARFLNEIKSMQGIPYVWGGESRSGVDCSGLIQLAAKQAGINFPWRTTTAQWAALQHIPANQAQPGDLVYFTGADPPSPGHVGVVTTPGHWTMIDAPQTGETVHEQPFSVPGMGDMHVVGFARLPGVKGSAAPGAASSGGGGLFSLIFPPDALALFDDATHFVNSAMWILNPENWLRILAGAAAVLLAVSGLVFLVKAA
jgi:NlpC/P60 family